MKIQLNTDVHIDGTAALAAQVSGTVGQAVHGPAQKLARLLDSTLGRLHDHRHDHGKSASGAPSSGTEPAQR